MSIVIETGRRVRILDCRRFESFVPAGGIPTGLFTYIDPDPVLTTLCVAGNSANVIYFSIYIIFIYLIITFKEVFKV